MAVARSSWGGYVMLLVPTGVLSALYLTLAVKQVKGAWVVVGVLVVIGFVGTFCLWRLRLVITEEAISYRGIFRAFRVPIADIKLMRGGFLGREEYQNGFPRGPGVALSLDVCMGGRSSQFRVNIKPFDKRELRKLLGVAKYRGIPLCLDDAVEAMLGKQEL